MIRIYNWMANKLHLSGNELIIYAFIYRYEHVTLHMIYQYMAISKNSCIANLKKLISKELIIKTENKINNIKFYEYAINFDSIDLEED